MQALSMNSGFVYLVHVMICQWYFWSSTIITQSNVTQYSTHHCIYWSRISTRVSNYALLRLPMGVFCEDLVENSLRFNSTALYVQWQLLLSVNALTCCDSKQFVENSFMEQNYTVLHHNFLYNVFYAIHCIDFHTIWSPTGRVFSAVSVHGTCS